MAAQMVTTALEVARLAHRSQRRGRARHRRALAFAGRQFRRRAADPLRRRHLGLRQPVRADRADSDRMMCEHAVINGANAIVAMRYDANEILSGVAEAIRQGAAVVAEPER